MSKITDFQCTYDYTTGIGSIFKENTDLKFPEAYKEWEAMTQLAIAIKERDNAKFCELPFCHTLEAEALGGIINYGDENIGPRVKEYICTTAEELLRLPEIDFTKGRIAEVLKACRYLREKGEDIILYVSGPFTILNTLMDAIHIFKILKKNPEAMHRIFEKLQNEILRFIEEALKSGVNMISYGDSTGGLNILGPKLSEEVVERFTYPLCKRVEDILEDRAIMLLCPKTALALLGTEKAVWKDINIGKTVRYLDGCKRIIGKAKFTGQMCAKNRSLELKNGIIKAIDLL
ncbi:uroporphyrinogen decarboxylase family protein [Proteiniborus sp. MB09-C3]|uniref:uroporphyrinogen decarboxylase family protein n=1 Tax=Proteiniborus sp. MB09-C3 TaxID=3050072 RepID=UPI002557A194|nr:uroporphyrinogen decarboxylase family protein [Proteiniborus sp. MB09-C3]WIV12941.1 uroporphyrinogen decarboxylase family protein [Proteiniborus sp. MB09-C3]